MNIYKKNEFWLIIFFLIILRVLYNNNFPKDYSSDLRDAHFKINKDIERGKRLAHPIGNMPITPQ